MAKNKKPRKPYHPRPCRMPMLKAADRDELVHLLEHTEFAVYNHFPCGNAEYQHVEATRRVMNHAMAGMLHRRNVLDDDECSQAILTIFAAGEALQAVAARHNKLYRQGRRDHLFVFTAEELKAVERGYVIASDFIKDSLDTCPAACLKEYYAAMILDARMDAGKIKNGVAAEIVDALIEQLSNTATAEWSKLV